MKKKNRIEITQGPENWEIIQHNDGYADIEVCGVLCEDDYDDEPFSTEGVYLRVVREDSGIFATPLTPVMFEGDRFSAILKHVPCGGPYLLDVLMYDDEKCICYPIKGDKRRHFCVGDVYIIAGQSNAAGMARGFVNEAPQMGIHVLRNMEKWDIATHPFNDSDYSKSGMFLAFANAVKKETACPIGLIPAAVGGVALSRWVKGENGDLYKKLLSVMSRHGISAKALFWYQGCSDAGDGVRQDDYLKRFGDFVKNIRQDLKNESLPVFTFQLNRFQTKERNERLDNQYDGIREAQRLIASKIENVYVLPAIDATQMSDFIHCGKASNVMLGERLASIVLEKMYNKGIGAIAPEISKVFFVSKKEIVLEFSNVTEFLYTFGCGAKELPIEIYDELGRILLDDYTVRKNVISLYLERECSGKTTISGQTGTDPEKIIIDFGTQIPMLCFKNYQVKYVT